MNFSLKPNTIISHLLPGAFLLAAVAAILWTIDPSWIERVALLSAATTALIAALGFLLILLCGLIIDAIRNLLESWWDKHSREDKEGIWWDFFFAGDEKKLEKLVDHYYGYYVFDSNLVIAIGAVTVIVFLIHFAYKTLPTSIWISTLVVVVLGIVLFFDAKNLRRDIKRLAFHEMKANLEKENDEGATT